MRGPRWGRGPLPSAGGPGWDRRRLEPAGWFPARSRAGIQAFSRESPDAKSRGGGPPPPHFYGPLVGTRSFWRLWRIVPVEGLFRTPSTCPDLETFFRKNAFQHIFPRKCVPNRFQHISSNSLTTVPKPTNPKPSEWERAALKPGVQGRSPGPLFPHFSGEMGTPAGQAGPPGRCAPRAASEPPTQRVLTTGNGLFAPSTPQIVNDIFE